LVDAGVQNRVLGRLAMQAQLGDVGDDADGIGLGGTDDRDLLAQVCGHYAPLPAGWNFGSVIWSLTSSNTTSTGRPAGRGWGGSGVGGGGGVPRLWVGGGGPGEGSTSATACGRSFTPPGGGGALSTEVSGVPLPAPARHSTASERQVGQKMRG